MNSERKDRLTVDLKGLRERIEAVRSDTAWKELSLGQKVRVLIQERLEQMENPGSFDKNLSSSANADVLSEK